MHESSLEKMVAFRRKYLDARHDEPLVIVDVGAFDVNGNYRHVFDAAPWRYLGLDVEMGPNVDILVPDPYDWSAEIDAESIDVVMSGSAFEHIEMFWRTAEQIGRILKPGGLLCIVAPASGPEHRCPVDCWRFYPDGLHVIARCAGLETLEARTEWEADRDYPDGSAVWKDSMLVARKPTPRVG